MILRRWPSNGCAPRRNAPAKLSAKEFALSPAGEKERICFPAQHLSRVPRGPAALPQPGPGTLDQGVVGAPVKLPETLEENKPNLLPPHPDRAYYELTKLRFSLDSRGNVEPPHKVIAEHFAVGLGVDLPESILEAGPGSLSPGRSVLTKR